MTAWISSCGVTSTTVGSYPSLLLGKTILSHNLDRRSPLPSLMANQLKSEYGAPCGDGAQTSGCVLFSCRHAQVTLVGIHGKEFKLKLIPLRKVRPLVLDDLVLSETSEEEGFNVNDQIAVSKFSETSSEPIAL
ncbi:hypothetical protein J3R82DRAFT_7978 [Butyriboletus roseoflavus]|nr:hypothetical protein J3R82DRAFT_7978 [Butyriboletus roseoflavus]